MSRAERLRLGLIVPFRDEEAVLARKLANLDELRWSDELRWLIDEQRVVFVDDHSRDAGAGIVAAAVSSSGRRPFRLECLAAEGPTGKPAAIRRALAQLQGSVDLVVLTDADVVLAPDALVALVEAFQCEPELALASGRQCFVTELSTGDALAQGTHSSASRWDRWTEAVRALESRSGLLVNVHGQLMAWRAVHGLAPRSGIAADDVDLVREVRARRLGKVRLIDGARFLEEKPRDPMAARAQALRRTRAFVQAMRALPAPGGGLLARAQWLAYRWLPASLPFVIGGSAVVLLMACFPRAPRATIALTLASALACSATTTGRALCSRLRLLFAAARAERLAPLSDHWARDRS